MTPDITLVGLNHRTAGVSVREKFSLASAAEAAGWPLPASQSLHESFLICTCNRVEIMGVGRGELQEELTDKWAALCGSTAEQISPYLYSFKGLDAVQHLFEVASSLDSLILGEPQILGQLKAAYRRASGANATGAILNRLLHKAFSVAKRVRHETAVASSAVSVSFAAVELARRIFGAMKTHKALLLGAGEMAELAAKHLLQAGVDEIVVLNRTLANGQKLAEQINGRAEPFEALPDCLVHADIVIASTGSPEPVIDTAMMKRTLKARRNRPVFLIDIAVPRDVEPSVNSLDNVYLYDIDDLKEVVEENRSNRLNEAEKARLIIKEEVEDFAGWLKALELKPTIRDLVQRGDEAAAIELKRTLKRLGDVSPETRTALEMMAKSIVRRLQHDPLCYLKQSDHSTEFMAQRISAIRQIFNLDNT